VKVVSFFNNKGGVGKTTLVYHLAWMYHRLGVAVVALDLDPQANLTAAFLSEERLEEIWLEGGDPRTIAGVVQPLLDRLGDIEDPPLEEVEAQLTLDPQVHLTLVPGDLALSTFEDRVAEAWPRCLDDNPAEARDGFRVTSAFYRIAERSARTCQADLVLVDVGPSLGSLNRAALIACDYVVMPLGADLYSLQGLRNLGPTLESWRRGWKTRLTGRTPSDLPLPAGEMKPIGYVILQHAVRRDRPVKAYQRWAERIPSVYHEKILEEAPQAVSTEPDPHQLASLKHYRSLMPLAQDAHKPMFLLTPADGAIGGHAEAVRDCFRDFKQLAIRIAEAAGISLP
jgi:chromosome partitioning protein